MNAAAANNVSDNPSHAASRYEDAAQAFERALREGGPTVLVSLGLAHARERQGRVEEASRAYLEAVRADPSTADTTLEYMHWLLTDDRDRQLARTLGSWLDQDWIPAMQRQQPMPAAVAGFLGRVSLYRQQYSRAAEWYGTAVAARPDAFALDGLGEALFRLGQVEAALPVLTRAVAAADATDRRDRAITTRRRLGDAYVTLGRCEDGIRVLREALVLAAGGDAHVWTALARARLVLERLDGAARAAERAAALDPRLAAAHSLLASVMLRGRKFTQAVTAAELALTNDPSDLDAIRVEGRALLEGHETLAGEDALVRQLGLLGSEPAADRSRFLIHQGIRLSRSYLEERPDDIDHRLLLARSLRGVPGLEREAIPVLMAVIERTDDRPDSRLLLELAETLLQVGDAAGALKALDRHVEHSTKEHSRCWQVRGDALGALGRLVDALDAYQRALDILTKEGGSPDLHLMFNLAVAARQNGKPDLAWSAVQTAIERAETVEDRARAYVLKAELTSERKVTPEEALAAAYEAGRQSYFSGNLEAALEWLNRTLREDEAYEDARWLRLDTLRRLAARSSYPFLNQETLSQARQEWADQTTRMLPTARSAWAFVTGALLADGEGQLSPLSTRTARTWEAITYLERSLLLEDENLYAWVHLSRLNRVLSNYGNAVVAADRASELNRTHVEVLDEQLAIYADLCDVGRAREYLDERVERQRTPWIDGVEAFLFYLEDDLPAAIEAISRLLETDSDDIWNLSLRADCLRQTALWKRKVRREFLERAQTDYRKILTLRQNPAYASQQVTFGWAAYATGDLDLAIQLLEPLLNDALDPTRECCRALGCCYLRRNDLDRASDFLTRGIDGATALSQLRALETLWLAEIREESTDWENGPAVRALILAANGRLAAARLRLGTRPSAAAELKSVLAWKPDDAEVATWSKAAALAGSARVALRDGHLEEASRLYASLAESTDIPEARHGLRRVAARYREEGVDALDGPPADRPAADHAVLLLERAFELEGDAADGAQFVELGIARLRAGRPEQAIDAFVLALPLLVDTDPAVSSSAHSFARAVLAIQQNREWQAAVLEDLRRLAETGVPESVRPILSAAIEFLSQPSKVVLGPAQKTEEQPADDVVPILVEVADNLAPEERYEDHWPFRITLLPEMRDRIEDEMGVRVGEVLIRPNMSLSADSFAFTLGRVAFVRGQVLSAMKYSPAPEACLTAGGIPRSGLRLQPHPISHRPGFWISQEHWESAAALAPLWEPMQFVLAQLEAVLRENLVQFVGDEEVGYLLDTATRAGRISSGQAALLFEEETRGRFVYILQELVRDRVPITHLGRIVTAFLDNLAAGDETLIRLVRLAMKDVLPGNGPFAVQITAPSELEQAILLECDRAFIPRFPIVAENTVDHLTDSIRSLVDRDDPFNALVVQTSRAREPLAHTVHARFPRLLVQSREETIEPGTRSVTSIVPLIAEWGDSWPGRGDVLAAR
jgi:tetratricopeptide (TPR) repeat protein